MLGEGFCQHGTVTADLPLQHLLKVTVLLNEALDSFLKPAATGVEILFEGSSEIRVDFVAGAIQCSLQVCQQLLAFPPYRVSINLPTCVLQR